MEFHYRVLSVFAFLVVLVAASHATSSSQEYWKKLLPNTPIPKTIQDSLKSEGHTGVTVGSHGVDVGVGSSGKDGKAGKGPKNTSVYVNPGKNMPFIYQYAATKTQLQDNPNVALFFLQNDLKAGTQMNLHFTKSTNKAPLLPKSVAQSLPFSSEKRAEILVRFHVAPGSKEAETMEDTIKACEAKNIQGEEKFCATSLETLLDYTTSKLGKNVDVISTYVEKDIGTQKYVFVGVRKSSSSKVMVCHKMSYAYGVFYCHKTETTKAYKVSLVGPHGTKVQAAVICHTDTSNWNPKHLAFQVLKVNPGSVPICHFLPEDHIVFVSK